MKRKKNKPRMLHAPCLSKSIAIGNKQQSSEVADRVAASRFTLHEKGFTLLESLVAIAVFTVGVSAAIVLIISSLNVGTRTQHKIIAANLAQEGIEATRNIRDRNWLSGKPWTDAIADTTSPYTLTGCIQWDGNAIDATCALGTRLVFDGSHYAHDPAASDFSRTISTQYFPADISTGDPEKMKISSVVACGTDCSITLEDYLYNWK